MAIMVFDKYFFHFPREYDPQNHFLSINFFHFFLITPQKTKKQNCIIRFVVFEALKITNKCVSFRDGKFKQKTFFALFSFC